MKPAHRKKLIATSLGALVLGYFSSMQFMFIIGEVRFSYYLLPALLGSAVGYLIGTLITRKDELKEQLETARTQLDNLYKDSASGSWQWNLKTKTLVFDQHWADMLGYSLEEISSLPNSWESLIHPEDLDSCYHDIERHLQGETEQYQNTHRMRHKNGEWLYMLDRGEIKSRDAKDRPVIFAGTQTNVTQRKKLEIQLLETRQKLSEYALTDSLTGLKNRKAMNTYLEPVWAYYRRHEIGFSIIMIDIDYFKEYNDTYGALKADECLRQVAKKVQQGARRTNDIAVRFSMEQFVVVLSGINAENTAWIADKIRLSVEGLQLANQASKCNTYVTISIGTANCSKEQQFKYPIEVYKHADSALNQAKNAGGNRVIASKAFIAS